LDDVTVYSSRLGGAASLPVTINVTTSAQVAVVTHSGAALASATTLEVQGQNGTATLSFASGAAASAIVAGVNAETANTGVSAALSGTDGVRFNSTEYGADAFVSVTVVTGTFDLDSEGGTGTDYGRDAAAIVNGRLIQGQGLKLTYVGSPLTFSATLDEGFGAGQVDSFDVTGGGLTFQIGAGAAAGVTVGIPNLASAALGGTSGRLSQIISGGSVDATDNASDALAIVDAAIQEVALLEGRLGGFATYTLDRTANALSTAYTQLATAHDAIANTDYALETANFHRGQMLNQASLTMLLVANQQAANVLSLLATLT
jgi:flagellin